MAWIVSAPGRPSAYRVRWREAGRAMRAKAFRSIEEAEAFRDLMDAMWPPHQSSKPRSGAIRRRGGRQAMAAAVRTAKWIVVDDCGCWRWTGQKNRFGYGQLTVNRDGKSRCLGAHRFSYEAHVGPIPEGLEIDHLCRVRDCVNPEHLEPVTRAENVRRSWAARKAAASS